MRHIFLAGVLAVAIMGCADGENCEVQEQEIDCLEEAAAVYDVYTRTLHERWTHLDGNGIAFTFGELCDVMEDLQADGCADVVEVPAYCAEP